LGFELKYWDKNMHNSKNFLIEKMKICDSFAHLVGIQRDVIILMCNNCNPSTKITMPLSHKQIRESLGYSTLSSIVQSVKRLVRKGCLIRVRFKIGRGGWTQYRIPENIYHDALTRQINWNFG
jgi:hypothetical protein